MKKTSRVYLLVILVIVIGGGVLYAVSRAPSSPAPQPTDNPPEDVSSSTSATSTPREGITVTVPHPGDLVAFPIAISGYVNGGGWGAFEGYAGSVRILDANGNEVVSQTPLMATSEWTQIPVSFEGTVGSASTTVLTATGTIVIQSENPKGDGSGKELRIPVRFK